MLYEIDLEIVHAIGSFRPNRIQEPIHQQIQLDGATRRKGG